MPYFFENLWYTFVTVVAISCAYVVLMVLVLEALMCLQKVGMLRFKKAKVIPVPMAQETDDEVAIEAVEIQTVLVYEV